MAVVNSITKDKIAAINAEKTAAAMAEVMPSSAYDKVEYTGSDSTVSAIYKADSGYVVEVAPQGFGGEIDMVVGIDADGTITGVSIIKMSETSGLGSRAKSEDWFLEQYAGKTTGDTLVVKDNIDALSGATVTSKAVTSGVNSALAAAADLLG